jgi:hypothetical protein
MTKMNDTDWLMLLTMICIQFVGSFVFLPSTPVADLAAALIGSLFCVLIYFSFLKS